MVVASHPQEPSPSASTSDSGIDWVNKPPHYQFDDPTYEPAKVIRAWNLGFSLGNTVKYIARAGRKGDRVEDLGKARWYLNDEIEFLEPSPPPVDPTEDHDSIDAIRMMEKALDKASMKSDSGMEHAMKDEVRVLRAIAEQGWVVIREEHV